MPFLAIVTKVSPREQGGVRLKAAAAFAESGPIHDTVSELWKGAGGNKRELLDKVGAPIMVFPLS